MTTRRETILQQIATALGSVSGVVGVYRARQESFEAGKLPAIMVEAVQDTPQAGAINYLDWTLQVRVMVFTRGALPDSEIDPFIASLHTLIMGLRNSGGSIQDILPVSHAFRVYEGGDGASCSAECLYNVVYRTSMNDLTA